MEPRVWAIDIITFFTRIDLKPLDLTPPFVGLLDCCVEHTYRGRPDIGSCPIPFDVGDDRIVGNLEFPPRSHCDFLPLLGWAQFHICHCLLLLFCFNLFFYVYKELPILPAPTQS